MTGRLLRTCAAAVCILAAGGAAAQPAVPAGTYTVDAGASNVRWLIYRSGALARFGHNHVISVGDMSGTVEAAVAWSDSAFEIEIPLESLVVDDPGQRAAAGDEFSSEPSADDIAGTRRNMLGEDLLDAERHPVMRIVGTEPAGTPGEGEILLTIDLAGRETSVRAPLSVELSGDALTAAGSFTLTHEQLGLEPFTALGGALRVAEPIDFTYEITARRAEPAP